MPANYEKKWGLMENCARLERYFLTSGHLWHVAALTHLKLTPVFLDTLNKALNELSEAYQPAVDNQRGVLWRRHGL